NHRVSTGRERRAIRFRDGWWDLCAIAVRHDNCVSGDVGFHSPEQQVVRPAAAHHHKSDVAGGKKPTNDHGSPPDSRLHILCITKYFLSSLPGCVIRGPGSDKSWSGHRRNRISDPGQRVPATEPTTAQVPWAAEEAAYRPPRTAPASGRVSTGDRLSRPR